MDKYKLLLILCVNCSLVVKGDKRFSHSTIEKTLEMIYNDKIISWNSTNVSGSTTEKRHVIRAVDASKSQSLQQITNISMEGRGDMPANTSEIDAVGLMDIPAGSVTNSVSELSTSSVVGKLADVESCRHKCGEKRSAPCSCDLKCLVYKNCCEDMLTECPEVVAETRIKYGHLLNVKVECTKNRIFLITECGTRQQLEDFRTNLSTSFSGSINLTKSTSLRGGELLSQNNASSVRETLSPNATRSMRGTLRFSDSRINAFIKNMYDAYVTDAATGFTYRNMDIFSCNAAGNSLPVLWSTVYSEPANIINHTTLGSIAQALTGSFNMPPKTETVYSPGTECEIVVQNKCIDKYKINESNLEHKCKEYISYVWLPNSPSSHIYGNKYCALCILGPDSSNAQYITAYTGQRTDTAFIVQGFTVTLSDQFVTIDTFGETIYPWKTVTCRLPETNLTEPITGDIPCVADKCNDYCVLRHDDVCKFSYFTTMAVADDTFPLTRNEYEMFPKFARCFLELHNSVDFDSDFAPTVALFERRRNMVIYATDFFYYETIGYHFKPESHIIHHIMLMAKVFKHYRGTTPRTPHTFKIKNSIFSLATFNELRYDLKKTYYTANHPNNVTACFCTEFNPYVPRLTRLPCVMSCVQDDVDVQAVSEYLQSPCFSVFNVSTGHARHVEFNMLSIFVLVSTSTLFQLKIHIFIMT